MQELIVRIKALVGRACTFIQSDATEQTCYQIGKYRFDVRRQLLLFENSRQELSHRETEILKRLYENRNCVVNMQDILLDLWGDDMFFNQRSLHVFITKLRHKLAGDANIRIINVRGVGYKLIETDSLG